MSVRRGNRGEDAGRRPGPARADVQDDRARLQARPPHHTADHGTTRRATIVGLTLALLAGLVAISTPGPAAATDPVPCARRLVDSESSPVRAGALSPDGERAVVAVGTSPGDLVVRTFDTLTGDELGHTSYVSSDLRSLAVSDEGGVAVADAGRVLTTTGPGASLGELLGPSETPTEAVLEFAADGRLFFTYDGPVPGTPTNTNPMVYVADLATGSFEPLFNASGGAIPDGAVALGDVTPDGATAVVRYRATNLGLTTTAFPTNESPLAFVDTATGAVSLASRPQASNGSVLGVWNTTLISVTDDGSAVYWRKSTSSGSRPILRYRKGQTFTEQVYDLATSGSVSGDGTSMALDRTEVLALDLASTTTQVAGELVARTPRETRSRAVTRSDGANLVLATLVGGNGAVLVSLDRGSCAVSPHPESLWYDLSGQALLPEAPLGSPEPNREASGIAPDGTYAGQGFAHGIIPVAVDGAALWWFNPTGSPQAGWGDLYVGSLVAQACPSCPSGQQWGASGSQRLLTMESTGWSVPAPGQLIVRTSERMPGNTSNRHGGSLVRVDLRARVIDRYLTNGQHWGLGLASSMAFAVSPGGRYVVTGARANQDRAPGTTLQPIVYDLEANSATGVEAMIGAPLSGDVSQVDFAGRGRIIFSMVDGGVATWHSVATSRFSGGGGGGGGDPDPWLEYVALGDSFASGEGLATAQHLPCGQALFGTYAHLLEASEFPGFPSNQLHLRACSGATSTDVNGSQFTELDQDVDLVTVSAGGNDVDFGGVLKYCHVKASCQDRFVDQGEGGNDSLQIRIRNTYDKLYLLYHRLRAEAENASVVVVGYPHLVVDPEHRVSVCDVGLSNGELEWFRQRTVQMNLVQLWAAQDAGVTFVNMLDAFGEDGGVCGANRHLNSISDIASRGYVDGAFHPNHLGHQAFYDALTAAGVLSLPTNPVPLGYNPPSGGPDRGGVSDLVVEDANGCAVARILIPAGCLLRIGVDGARTGAEWIFTLFSDPVTLGTGTAGSDGVVELEVELPEGVPRGPHTILAEPLDPVLDDEVAVATVVVAEPASAPQSVVAVPGDGEVTVAWEPPTDDGGLEITGYEVRRNGAVVGEVGGEIRTFTEEGLDNGTEVTYEVVAVTAVGPGAVAVSPSVTPAPTRLQGTVTDRATAAPIAGAFVAALRAHDFSLAAATTAAGNGSYSLDLPPGSYLPYLVDPTGSHLPGFDEPVAAVTLAAATTASADVTMAAATGQLAATVTDAATSEPVAGAWTLALSTSHAEPGAVEAHAVTGPDGRTTLPPLRAGQHFLGAVDPSGEHATVFHPSSPSVPGATPLLLTAGAVTNAELALPPQSPAPGGTLIEGTVTDDGGAPLAGGLVVALRASDFVMTRGATTDAQGDFELDVPAGEYRLAFIDPSTTMKMEWFDDVDRTNLAASTVVTAPGRADASLAPRRGTIAGVVAAGGTPLEGIWVFAIGPDGVAGGVTTTVDGAYELPVSPGPYRITFVDPAAAHPQEFYEDSVDFAGASVLTVQAGATTVADGTLGP